MAPFAQTQKPRSMITAPLIRKGLRLKLTLLLVGVTFLPPILIGFTNGLLFSSDYILLQVIVLPFLLSFIGSFCIWWLFKPLEQLYQSSLILARGEIKHRINLNTGDELELIALSLNSMAKNLDESFNKLAYDKDIIIAERNKLDIVISSIVDGIIVLDMNRKILLVNRAAEQMTGYNPSEMIDKQFDSIVALKDLGGTHIPVKDYHHSVMQEDALSQRIPHFVDLIGKDGNRIQAEVTFAPIVGGIKANLGSIIILHDITQEKVFEQMQIDFVSMASHEVRTPLTIIINYLSTLTDEVKGKLTPDQQQFLERSLNAAQQLSVLVNNMLNVSKIERGSFAVQLKPIPWSARLTELVEDMRAQAIQKNISLKLNLPKTPLPEVLADTVRINEVVNNLINNAISYTKEGGIITVGAMLKDDQILTFIQDNGPGIPKEAMSHLFGKFFRVPGALEQGSKGSGLGLFITKSIIELHKGQIWVESKLGQGSTFFFTLPLAESSKVHPTLVQLQESPILFHQ